MDGRCDRLSLIDQKILGWRFEFYWYTGPWHADGGCHPGGLLWPLGCSKVCTVILEEIVIFLEEVLLDMDTVGR